MKARMTEILGKYITFQTFWIENFKGQAVYKVRERERERERD